MTRQKVQLTFSKKFPLTTNDWTKKFWETSFTHEVSFNLLKVSIYFLQDKIRSILWSENGLSTVWPDGKIICQ